MDERKGVMEDATLSATDVCGMTLAEYAAAVGTHPQRLRGRYAAMMREGVGLALPELTRREDADGVVKFCLPVATAGGGTKLETESVIIPMVSYRGSAWYTLCISSQVGCRMGCTFCETGRMGLLRNLTAGEIVQQRLVARGIRQEEAVAASTEPRRLRSPPSEDHEEEERVEKDKSRGGAGAQRGAAMGKSWAARGPRYFVDGIQNIVFMGMGEPLDNFENTVQAIRVFNEPAGLDFPHGQITVSTVGRIDGIRKLAGLGWRNLRLAISLNAADDRLRDELMPINRGMPLAELQRALLEYPLAKKGRFLIEYVLIKGVNDSLADASAVARWCRPLRCTVNLIPYNPPVESLRVERPVESLRVERPVESLRVERPVGRLGVERQRGASYETPSDETILAFLFHLRGEGIFVKRRVTRGRDMMGACGQLGNPAVRRGKLQTLNAER